MVFVIVAIAVVFRFYRIQSIPPGLYPDEAMNGNNALEALQTGEFKVFYPENNGREGLFINIQALSLKTFGNHPWALRIVSAIFGVFTVLGTYFLARQLFNWQIGAISSFLMATSFWHTLFSRIGFRAIMAPFLLVWGFYFFWRGLEQNRLRYFFVSGIFWGLGFYTYIAFRIMPLAMILALFAYWYSLKKDFSHGKYQYTRDRLIKGMALFMITVIIVALPIGLYYYNNPGDFLGRTGQLSIFTSANPLVSLTVNLAKTLAMFNFVGDYNWRHNYSGDPLLFWPVGIFFIIGFTRNLIKLADDYDKHRHLPTVRVLLISWFFLGLLPVILSNEGLPHALRAIILAPVVFIFAGEGLWWIYEFVRKWYGARDFHDLRLGKLHVHEGNFIAGLVIVIFLIASMVFEFDRYFFKWALNPNVPPAFSARYVEIGNYVEQLPRSIKKYVVVNVDGVLINNIPMSAQTVMYITDTYTPEKQAQKNIYYLTEEQHRSGQYNKASVVILLENENK
mgnify:CR=1 FL=1